MQINARFMQIFLISYLELNYFWRRSKAGKDGFCILKVQYFCVAILDRFYSS